MHEYWQLRMIIVDFYSRHLLFKEELKTYLTSLSKIQRLFDLLISSHIIEFLTLSAAILAELRNFPNLPVIIIFFCS